ncbi:MAG TPA: hypothetical protein VEH80_02775 [Candidatus Bathyarchaeia archaeon]|nr:hypothetical protein [Candidatus Bathyarchaeia archaeon]
MTRRLRRLTRRFRSLAFLTTVLRSYRDGRRRGRTRLVALRTGRAVAKWQRRNRGGHL